MNNIMHLYFQIYKSYIVFLFYDNVVLSKNNHYNKL